MSAFIDRSGCSMGFVTIESRGPDYVYHNGKRHVRWNCVCACGKRFVSSASNIIRAVRTGSTTIRSCGCQRGAKAAAHWFRHGGAGTRAHRIWKSMRQRCLNPNNPNYFRYGGRGIKIDPRWDSFEKFVSDMGQPPSVRHSIDRINNNGNYEPANCRWATFRQQARNKRNNRILTINGVSKCLTEWSAISGNSDSLISHRLKRGRLVEEAVFAN